MADIHRIRADLVIIGGGFMGLALARQALLKGLRPIVIDKNQVQKHHYMSGLLSPRADYLSLDMDEVELTAHECQRWLGMFPNIVKPSLFIMPFNSNTPYSYDFLEPAMKFYDRSTSTRLGNFYKPHFRINRASLEKKEPNLRKGYFHEALGFYELTADPDVLLDKFKKEIMLRYGYNFIFYPDRTEYKIREGRIESVELVFDDRNETFLIENKDSLIVVNCAGPWMQDTAGTLGINLPIKYGLGFQVGFKGEGIFKNPIIAFGLDGKYSIISQKEEHVQIGPTNTPAKGPGDLDDMRLQVNALEYLSWLLKDTLEPSIKLTKPHIRSAGLRVKLKLPFVPDSNRPFILNPELENYFVLYPGKAVLALKTAEEFLCNVLDGRQLTLCINGENKIQNSIKLNWLRIKSLFKLGLQYLLCGIKKTLKI